MNLVMYAEVEKLYFKLMENETIGINYDETTINPTRLKAQISMI